MAHGANHHSAAAAGSQGNRGAGKNETAHRARSIAGRVFCYAHATGRARQGDITLSLRHALAPVVVEHHPSITNADEVGQLLLAIDSYSGQPETRCALKLSPLVILRPFELRFAEWSEINFEKAEWRIPAERMKMDSPHILPAPRLRSAGAPASGKRTENMVIREQMRDYFSYPVKLTVNSPPTVISQRSPSAAAHFGAGSSVRLLLPAGTAAGTR
jgi:hypothetical protein